MTISLGELSESDRIHTFSISSAPCEERIAITTRLRDSSFKRALSQLEPGNVVEIDGPYGNFVVSPDVRRPVAFLVGGVGITPAVSILKQAAQDSALAGFYLFYSNRDQTEAPFLTELTHIQADSPEFHLIATMTADQSWIGERERISMDMIRKYVDPEVASFFISGPPNMVTGMRDMLTTAGITREQVRFEAFAGY